MEPDDEVGFRRAMRRAVWRGARGVLILEALILLVAAILFPVFATAYNYSGPGMGPYRIANAIDDLHREKGRWATSYAELSPYVHRYPRHRTFTISLVRLDTKAEGTEYLICVNGLLRRYRFSSDAKWQEVGAPIGQTILNPEGR